jgi:F0F1-type ATP synthase assembly protein I
MKIFLSFVSRDRGAAEQIIRHLRASGFDIVTGHAEISPGAHWPSELLRAIKSCDAVVVLLSAASLKSEYASFEISAAVASKEKILIPVVLEKGLELPFFLRDIHYIDLSNPRDWQEGLDSLVRALTHSQGRTDRLDEEVRETLAQERRLLTLERAVQEAKSETREAVLRKSLLISLLVTSLLVGLLTGLLSGLSYGLVSGLVFGLVGAVSIVVSRLAWHVESRSHHDQRSRDE